MKLIVSKVGEYTGEISKHLRGHVRRIHNYCLCYKVIECFNVARYITMRMMVSMGREYTLEIGKRIRGHVIRINEWSVC